ncbi:hypothetical protein GGR57DRAFT_53426 [Xylariaceae sp. FL1272]|nr:hypothetical protein GGR57DRAFT_53426 [Xylariaceae sp. FL1272]
MRCGGSWLAVVPLYPPALAFPAWSSSTWNIRHSLAMLATTDWMACMAKCFIFACFCLVIIIVKICRVTASQQDSRVSYASRLCKLR